ncbi:DUF6230 family protein [Flexivirga meconopsidis]|uniref:DUF6230 family protein n=1 Tax=Flexivirga meconopsidis TaxID=2977121 RepID=UPI00223F7835|nr:DUF6230 family protein [Flexivirga meconopsidis]
MSTDSATRATVRTGTRWGRAGALAAAGVAATIGLGTLMSQNVLATQVTFQGNPSQVSVGGLTGNKVGITVVRSTRSVDGKLTTGPALRVGAAGLQLDGLCLSQKQSIAGIDYTVRVSAGDGNSSTHEIQAQDATFDVTSIKGDGNPGLNLDGVVEIGVSGDSLVTTDTGGEPDPNPLGAPSGTGWFGINSGVGQFSNIRGRMYGFKVSEVAKMPGVRISVTPGTSDSCDSKPIQH